MSLLIHGGKVLNSKSMDLEQADILIQEDRISAVGPNLPAFDDAQKLNAVDQIILPGLINAHTHAHNNLLKASGDNWTLEDLLNHGAALNSNRTIEAQYVSAAIGAVEMIKTGCTATFDMFMSFPSPNDESIEAVVRAYTDVGLRAVVAPAVADIVFYRTVPGLLDLIPKALRQRVESIQASPTEGLLRMTENAIQRWNGSAGGRIHLGVAPTIPGQCTDTFLAGCLRLLQEYGVRLHTHLAETKVQALYGVQRWGKTIVGHLADIGLLGPHFIGGHGVWLTDEDIQLLADTGSLIVHNPASNLKLGSGIAPIREMLDRGITVGLGADGSMSSDNQNLFEAMRFAALVGKVRFPHRPLRWVGALDVWKMATSGSATLLGMMDDIGSIAPGRKADLILLQSDSVFLRPLNHVINALVYTESGADVTTVLIDGRMVLHHGRMLTVDESRLRSQAQEGAESVRKQNTKDWAFAEQLAPYISAACQKTIKTSFPVNRYAVPIESEP
jgi:5-methylthioadenosine/S-adenosylhomocysteine deaminase